VKDQAQETTKDGQSSVIIVDKAMRPEPVHEVTDPGPRRTDHLCEGILIDSGDHRFSLAGLYLASSFGGRKMTLRIFRKVKPGETSARHYI
jgi:hypothetical protein